MSGWTLAFQTVNFLVLAAILYRFLFKPVTAIVARRQGEIEAASNEAERAKRAAEESRTHFEQERDKLRADAEVMRVQLRAEIAEQHEKALQQARSEAAALLEAARAEIERERQEAATAATDEALAVGVRLAARLLEQASGPAIAETLLERVCAHLEHLPADRRRTLSEELARGDGSLEVATAPSLAAQAQERWAQRIARDLDGAPAVRFVADAHLVAGAELRFPYTKISVCWRDGLDAAREELTRHADSR